jgi:hypothetical protein
MQNEDREENRKQDLLRGYAAQDKVMLDGALRSLVRTYEGRRYVWWLLEVGKVGQQPFNTDPYATAFNSGQLNVGQQILAHLTEVAPEAYLQMIQENIDANRTRSKQLERGEASAEFGGSPVDGSGSDEPDWR